MDAMNLVMIYEEYAERVYRYMRYRIQNDQDAEDLTSAVFERVMKNASRFDARKGSFEAWLFTVARNQLRDHARRIKRRQIFVSVQMEDQPSPDSSPDRALVESERFEALKRALTCLSERELTIVSLKYAGELRNVDIAKVMRLSEKNIGVILCRAMKKLRKAIDEEELYESSYGFGSGT